MINKLFDLLISHILPFLGRLWESVFLWRITSLILLVLFCILVKYRKKITDLLFNDKIADHDKNIFHMSNNILSESELYDILDRLDRLRRYNDSKSRNVFSYLMFFKEQGNKYIRKQILNTHKIFYQYLCELNTFMAQHFFVYPNDQNIDDFQYCLYPKLNPSQEGDEDQECIEQYENIATQLYDAVVKVENSYKEYRSSIQKYLYV